MVCTDRLLSRFSYFLLFSFMLFICFFHSLCTIFSFCFPCYLSLLSSSLNFLFRLSFSFVFSSFFLVCFLLSFLLSSCIFHLLYLFHFPPLSCLLILFLFLFSCFMFSFFPLAFCSLAFSCMHLLSFLFLSILFLFSVFLLRVVPFYYSFHSLFLFFLRDWSIKICCMLNIFFNSQSSLVSILCSVRYYSQHGKNTLKETLTHVSIVEFGSYLPFLSYADNIARYVYHDAFLPVSWSFCFLCDR